MIGGGITASDSSYELDGTTKRRSLSKPPNTASMGEIPQKRKGYVQGWKRGTYTFEGVMKDYPEDESHRENGNGQMDGRDPDLEGKAFGGDDQRTVLPDINLIAGLNLFG